ncbi:hypothetical protein [Desertivirga brevis]|uniref:hypothetical protein n=1 Tax=Desertivirga brevis TaxID=2810310 RepID=UPI001A960A29|nr:hypothetical protein [Pedobacter sp. SYSU D00873]
MKHSILPSRICSLYVLSNLLLLPFPSVGQEQQKLTYEITGTIKGADNDRIFLILHPSDVTKKFDTVEVRSVGEKLKMAGNLQKQRRVSLKGNMFYWNSGVMVNSREKALP